MSDQTNGDNKGRLDRVEEMLEVLALGHILFREEYCQLLRAQGRFRDTLKEVRESLERRFADLKAASQHADERMAALIDAHAKFRVRFCP